MVSSEFGNSLTPEQQLAAAKDSFRSSMLDDDAFFAFLQTQLPSLGERERLLPDFGLEPTIKRYPDSTSDIGVRISRSGQIAASGITSHVKVYNHLPLLVINRVTGVAVLAPELEKYLSDSKQAKQVGIELFKTWQRATQELQAELPAGTFLDPINGTFELDSTEQWNAPNNN